MPCEPQRVDRPCGRGGCSRAVQFAAALVFAGIVGASAPAVGGDETAGVASLNESRSTESAPNGPRQGDYVPNFYVRAVTGPLRNKSVCYVCRNGDRPVVMVLVRQLNGDLPALLKGIDEIVDGNRAAGLKSFGVLLSNQPLRDAAQLQTLGFDEKIAMPLTVAPDAPGAPAAHSVAPGAMVQVVLYRSRRVVSSFRFGEDELRPDETKEVLRNVQKFIRD